MTAATTDTGDGIEEWQRYILPRSKTGFLAGRLENNTVTLLRCPACGKDFTHEWRQSGGSRLPDHLQYEHEPEDFGLTREHP
jgi:hypothetical protein